MYSTFSNTFIKHRARRSTPAPSSSSRRSSTRRSRSWEFPFCPDLFSSRSTSRSSASTLPTKSRSTSPCRRRSCRSTTSPSFRCGVTSRRSMTSSCSRHRRRCCRRPASSATRPSTLASSSSSPASVSPFSWLHRSLSFSFLSAGRSPTSCGTRSRCCWRKL